MNKAISVIITVRGNEPYLEQTIANIRGKAGCKIEIIVVYDGTDVDDTIDADKILHFALPKGVGPARHAGIMAAKYPLVFLTDSHMDFSQDFGKVILDAELPDDHISCGRSIGLIANNGALSWDNSHNGTGCRFGFKFIAAENQHWIMSGQWKPQSVNGFIGCVYGACYAFSKKWYKKIGAPLALLKGWGMDEEVLSAATWLAGGCCVLLDYKAAHLFKNKRSIDVPLEVKQQFLLNQMLFLHLLPLPDASRTELKEWLNKNDIIAGQEITETPQVKAAKKLWNSWEWERLEPWIDKVQIPVTQPAQIKTRKTADRLVFAPQPVIKYVPRIRRRA